MRSSFNVYRPWLPREEAGAIVALQLAVAGTGAFAPTLTEQVALKTTIAGIGALAVNLTEQVALRLAVGGVGELVAFLRQTLALKLGAAGQGTVNPNLTTDAAQAEGEKSVRQLPHQLP